MKKLLASLVACALLAASPAFAGIAIIAGTGNGGSLANVKFQNPNVVFTTTAFVPAGSLIVTANFTAPASGSTTGFSCSDPANGTYNAAQAITGTAAQAFVQILYVYTVAPLANGSSITCTQSGTSGGFVAGVAAFSGIDRSPYDSNSPAGATGSGSGTTTVGPSGTLACPGTVTNCEVLIGAVVKHTTGTLTNDATYVDMSNGPTTEQFSFSYKIVSAATAQSFSPSWSQSANWAGQLQAFKSTTNQTCTIAAVGGGTC